MWVILFYSHSFFNKGENMRNINIVIGANFGDEGKGQLTDFFASKYKRQGIVVRFNGGAQAGHTVLYPNKNLKHVFSHIGSGTFQGLNTYLSKYFIVNPILFKKEFQSLINIGYNPVVIVNPECLVTIPYDMMINQIVESDRANNKHGSCGVGINETIKRSNYSSDTKIRFKDLYYEKEAISNFLKKIQKNYVMKRLKELKVENIPMKFIDLLKNNAVIDNFLRDCKFLLDNTLMAPIKTLENYNNIIFEGAQGLLLDQNNSDYFPNLTPSNTGMQNVAEIIHSLGFEKENIEIVYTTRPYLTRHGAGKLNNELSVKPWDGIKDETNIENQYQGSLRFAYLDLDLLKKTIEKDLKFCDKLNYKVKINLSCSGQVTDKFKYYDNAKLQEMVIDDYSCNRMSEALEIMLKKLNFNDGYIGKFNTTYNSYELRTFSLTKEFKK